jgi:hypothetical protein
MGVAVELAVLFKVVCICIAPHDSVVCSG